MARIQWYQMAMFNETTSKHDSSLQVLGHFRSYFGRH